MRLFLGANLPAALVSWYLEEGLIRMMIRLIMLLQLLLPVHDTIAFAVVAIEVVAF